MANFSLPSKSVTFVAIGLVIMVLGFILMIGGVSSDPDVFNPAMFNARRLVVAPIIICAGIGVIIWAIMRKPREEEK